MNTSIIILRAKRYRCATGGIQISDMDESEGHIWDMRSCEHAEEAMKRVVLTCLSIFPDGESVCFLAATDRNCPLYT